MIEIPVSVAILGVIVLAFMWTILGDRKVEREVDRELFDHATEIKTAAAYVYAEGIRDGVGGVLEEMRHGADEIAGWDRDDVLDYVSSSKASLDQYAATLARRA